MSVLLSSFIRTQLILLLISVVIINVDCRAGGHGKLTRVRVNLIKKKVHSTKSNINGPSAVLHKSSNKHIIVSGSAAVLFGTLALQSYVSNKHHRHKLTNGTGSLCVNKKNYSNYIYNEFRCPLSPIFPANDRYCCGSFQQQYCCSFWASNTRAAGVITGAILSCCVLVLFIIGGIIYYRRYIVRKESPSRMKSYLWYRYRPASNC